jgi:sialic acid synthase SpsE
MNIQLTEKRIVGDGYPAYIMAEVGINHNGDINIAKQLIDKAAIIGIDGVKFQKRTIHEMYREAFLNEPYLKESSFGDTYGSHKEFLEFSNEQLFDLKGYTESKGLDFIISGFDFSGFDFINYELKTHFHKLASPLVTHLPLLKHIAEYNKPMVLSTGMHTFDEVRHAVETILPINNKLILLQCTTSYPTNNSDVHLAVIKRFREEFSILAGYSSHDRGVVIPAASVMFGSCFIEKHFTLDRTMKGPDHVCSVEPRGLEMILKYARTLESAIGIGTKELCESEVSARLKYGYSCVANRFLKKGDKVTSDDIGYKVPGTGLNPANVDSIIGKVLIKDIDADSEIGLNDVV